GQQPTYYNQIRGQHGDRYADLTQEPAWGFGEGLSYTKVEYADLTLARTVLTAQEVIVAEVCVSNTGARPVRETVQVYVRDTVTSVSWTDKELKAYRQVDLEPGETALVRFELPVQDCSIVDAAGIRRVETGAFELLVGPSSREASLLTAGFEVVAS
ncbi:MAG TPA: fibronectin type III-like domain-contianing protein, partial [Diaminobutyricibacter sp.]